MGFSVDRITTNRGRLCLALLLGTALSGAGAPLLAQEAAPAVGQGTPAAAPTLPEVAPEAARPIRSIQVTGAQRLEPQTVLSYTQLRSGGAYTREAADQAIKDLYATDLFADVAISENDGAVTIAIQENPVINRVILEGNKRLKEDKIAPEIRLAPRQIFTSARVRADVARILELYRRQGRYAARVEPKLVQLDQNRVDVVFEIAEGPKSKVRAINIIGNEEFADDRLRGEMATKTAGGLLSFFKGNTSYDPDRLNYDQQKLRQFYLTQGYADFRVVSAVAELTPDREDFIITYVVEEGDRYKFGDVTVESEIRDLKPEVISNLLPMRKGDAYNAKQVEDTLERINETAGLFGYAFADARPLFERDRDAKTMNITFKVEDAPRVYVERVDVTGNTYTQDKVIRREFRLAEGDPFNSIAVKRSRDRIQSLGYFQESLEVKQEQGSAPDRVVLAVPVEERSTGELQFSAGFSSLERFIVNASIRQRNFRGMGQELRAGINYSNYAKSIDLGFTEPYLFDRNIAVGVDLYRQDYNSFNFTQSGERNTTYEQLRTGGGLRAGVPVTEFLTAAFRYNLNFDNITLDRDTFFLQDAAGNSSCNTLLAGRYLCDSLGKRTTSSVGYSLFYDNLNNRLRPSAGQRLSFSQDFAGLGGDVKYLRSRVEAAKFWELGRRGSGLVFSTRLEGGYIHSFEDRRGPGIDPIRINDRFMLGEPQLRGFDIRGVGPRVQRVAFDTTTNDFVTDRNQIVDDALGGRAYYVGRAELELPLGGGARSLGLRPSIFADVGAVFGITRPNLTTLADFTTTDPTTGARVVGARSICLDPTTNTSTPVIGANCPTGTTTTFSSPPFEERFLGNTPKPRVSVGVGVNWNSPFGPFRIDVARALVKSRGDDTKLVTFNVGTAF